MKRITLVSGPFDVAGLEFALDNGYLVAPNIAMYVLDGKLYLARVNATQIPRLYTQDGAPTVLGESERGEIIISEVSEKLTRMTALDFIIQYSLPLPCEIEYRVVSKGGE